MFSQKKLRVLPNISRAQTFPVAVSDTLQLSNWRLVRAEPLDSIVNKSSKALICRVLLRLLLVLVVVLSLRCIERSRMKCIQYWPENCETQEFSLVDITHQETLEFEDHVQRTFSLKRRKVGIAEDKTTLALKILTQCSRYAD